MKVKLLHIIRQWPLFLLLLPLFFMLHSFTENYAPGLGKTALLQALVFSGAGIIASVIFFPLFRDFRKAALVSLFLLSFNFFFGAIHDFIKNLLGPDIIIVRYTFIIAALPVLLAVLIIWLRKSKRKFNRLYAFLNVLFPVLIAVDLVSLISLFIKSNKYKPHGLTQQFISCDTCRKPDVYVIIADEYAGAQELREVFSFDNSAFFSELQSRGFHIVNNSRSNYNATVYSMASLFNMDYIELSGKNLVTQRDMLLCRSIISDNNAGRFFLSNGYSVFNYSFFDMQQKRKALTNFYFHPESRILNFGTFISRFQKDVLPNHFSDQKRTAVENNDFNNDETADSLLRKLVTGKREGPRFVYTHFTRPHHPYYVDRYGQFVNTTADTLKGFDLVKKGYTEHLLYTNKRLLNLVDHILKNSSVPPVILLASDHGFRQFTGQGKKEYYFMNLCTVLLPGRNYDRFYDGMTPVNTFRAILNAQFGQRLPMLKDSSSFVLEK